MAKRKRQYSTYTGEVLGNRIETAAEQHDISVAELLRKGAKLQLQQLEGHQ